MATNTFINPLRRFIGTSGRGREVESRTEEQDEVFFFEDGSRRENCGPGIGKVILNKDGSVILDAIQLSALTGYENRENLEPSIVVELPDGTYRVSVRK